jgi:hypothetical protein
MKLQNREAFFAARGAMFDLSALAMSSHRHA